MFPEPEYMPCPECGVSLGETERAEHVCDDEQRVAYQMVQLRDELDGLEREVAEFLDSPQGRFELWCARRRRAA